MIPDRRPTVSGLPSSAPGPITISGVAPDTSGVPPFPAARASLRKRIQTVPPPQSYIGQHLGPRTVNPDGTFGAWQTITSPNTAISTRCLTIPACSSIPTGSAHLLIGSAYGDDGKPLPLGTTTGAGNIRNVYLFNAAINPQGIMTTSRRVDIATATSTDLTQAGILGYWKAAYDPNGVVNNPFDQNGVAISINAALASLAPLAGYELEGTTLYINGYAMSLALVTGGAIPSSMTGYTAGSSLLNFNAGLYKLEEISIWSMTRQPYQIIDDMFGRLIPSNEPFLRVLYLSAILLLCLARLHADAHCPGPAR